MCVAASIFAVTYQPCNPSSFRSTSVYVTGATDYNQSAITNNLSPITSKATGSMTAISASNFAELNSEDGLCAETSSRSAVIRRGRPGGAIGEYDFHSPVGDTPWIVLAVLTAIYVILAKKRKKIKKNLVES